MKGVKEKDFYFVFIEKGVKEKDFFCKILVLYNIFLSFKPFIGLLLLPFTLF